MKTMTLILYLLACAFVMSGCHKTETSVDDDTEDTAGDADADSDGDSDSDSDSDSDGDADPVTFRIENNSGGPAYFWSSTPVQLFSSDGAELNGVTAWQPLCTMSCEDPSVLEDPMMCCIACDAMPTVLHIPDGNHYDATWSGNLHQINNEICECGCWESYVAPAGSYTARVCASSMVYLWDAGEPLGDEPELLYGAEAGGPFQCVQVTFDVPDSPDLIQLEVTATASPCTVDADCPNDQFCNECAHGDAPSLPNCVAGCSPHNCVGESVAECNMIRPSCEDTDYTAIIVDGCWDCSCKVW